VPTNRLREEFEHHTNPALTISLRLLIFAVCIYAVILLRFTLLSTDLCPFLHQPYVREQDYPL